MAFHEVRFPDDIAYSLRPGCDKTFSTCKDRYSNVRNFRGEPNVPGNDQVLAYPDGK